MRIVILMVLLALSACDRQSNEWVKLGGDELMTVYYNPTSLHRDGDIATMWVMVDYNARWVHKSATEPVYLSYRTEYQFDCKKVTSSTGYFIHFSENMGNGKVVELGDPYPSQLALDKRTMFLEKAYRVRQMRENGDTGNEQELMDAAEAMTKSLQYGFHIRKVGDIYTVDRMSGGGWSSAENPNGVLFNAAFKR